MDERYLEKIKPMESGEDEMLDCAAAERKPNSRLSCQIEITDELEGAVVQIPETQI